MADACERSRHREGDVALPAVGLVVGRLVDPGRVQEKPDREREDGHDERVPCAPLPSPRALLVHGRARSRGASRGFRGRRRRSFERAGLLLLGERRLLLGEGRKRWQRALGHQNWK
jgi:hypothetical protein